MVPGMTRTTFRGRIFPFLLALLHTTGYLHASLTVVLLDPQLKSHVRFPGGRTYPRAWMVPPAALLVFLLTFLVARYFPRLRVSLAAAPFVIVSAASNVVIFPQELPHTNIVFITSVWISILALWTWTHDSYVGIEDSLAREPESIGTLEYLKEKANFYRTMAFGLVAATLALLVTGLVSLHARSTNFLTDPREVYLLDQFSFADVSIFMLLILFCPIFEALKAWNRICDLFLSVKTTLPSREKLP